MTSFFEPGALRAASRHLARRDARLAPLIRRVGPCRLERRGDPYRALVRSILHQQIAGAAARAIEGRVRAFGRGRIPSPEALLALPEARLREAGLSRQKAASVRGVAEAFADRRLDARRLRRLGDAEVVDALTQLRGVGEWTAHMLLISSFGRPDVLPVGDYGVRKAAMLLYGLPALPKPRELEAIGEAWRPYRSIASWYLWRHLDDADAT